MYYISFIDDFSRNTWIYFLRKKSKVVAKFKEFKDLVENQSKKKIKVLRTEIMESYAGMNWSTSIRSVVWKGKILLHTHLNIMEFLIGLIGR